MYHIQYVPLTCEMRKFYPRFHISFHQKLDKPIFSTGKCEPLCRILPSHILETTNYYYLQVHMATQS